MFSLAKTMRDNVSDLSYCWQIIHLRHLVLVPIVYLSRYAFKNIKIDVKMKVLVLHEKWNLETKF